jgi:hypothetical protein
VKSAFIAVGLALLAGSCGATTVQTRPTASICQEIVQAQAATHPDNTLLKETAFIFVAGCLEVAKHHGMGARIDRAQAKTLALDYYAQYKIGPTPPSEAQSSTVPG